MKGSNAREGNDARKAIERTRRNERVVRGKDEEEEEAEGMEWDGDREEWSQERSRWCVCVAWGACECDRVSACCCVFECGGVVHVLSVVYHRAAGHRLASNKHT